MPYLTKDTIRDFFECMVSMYFLKRGLKIRQFEGKKMGFFRLVLIKQYGSHLRIE
jgi:hypothetical protein